LTDHEHATHGGLLKKGSQKLALFFLAHVLALASAWRWGVGCPSNSTLHEATT